MAGFLFIIGLVWTSVVVGVLAWERVDLARPSSQLIEIENQEYCGPRSQPGKEFQACSKRFILETCKNRKLDLTICGFVADDLNEIIIRRPR